MKNIIMLVILGMFTVSCSKKQECKSSSDNVNTKYNTFQTSVANYNVSPTASNKVEVDNNKQVYEQALKQSERICKKK